MIEQIKKDLLLAQKEKQQTRVSTLRMLLSSITNKEKEKRMSLDCNIEELDEKSKLTNEEIMKVISSEAKKRKDAIDSYEKAGRLELKEQEEKELQVLEKYLPEQMSTEEIKKIVEQIISEKEIKDMQGIGIIMKEAMIRTKGNADGRGINTIAKELLQ